MKHLYFSINKLFFVGFLLLAFLTADAQTLSIKASKTKICPGETVTLEASSGFVKYLWSNNSNDKSIKVEKAGWYYVSAWDSNSQRQTDSIEISMIKTKTLEVSAHPNKSICHGDTVTLEANKGFLAYQWSNSSTDRMIKVIPSTTTNYYVYAKDSSGCLVKAFITIEVRNCSHGKCDDLLAGNPKLLCKGGFIYIEAKSGFKTYSWSNSKTDRVIKVTNPGTYILTVYDSANNKCVDSIKVEYYQTKQVEIISNPKGAKICRGEKITLKGTDGYKSYSWSNNAQTQSTTVDPTTSTKFYLTVTDQNGCTSSTYIYVQVDSCKGIDSTSCKNLIKDREIKNCHGDTVKLEAPYGFLYYKWTDGKNFVRDGRYIVLVEGGTYYLMVKDSSNNYCFDTVYISKFESKDLKIEVTPYKQYYCMGDTVEISASNGFVSFDWSNLKTTSSFKLILEKSIELSLTAIDSNGCKTKKGINILVKDCGLGHDTCANLITAYPGKISCDSDSVKLIGKEGFSTYSWSNSNTSRYFYTKTAGKYILEAKTTNNKVCRDSIEIAFYKKQAFGLTADSAVCPGDTVVFEATGGMKSYGWSLGKDFSNKNRAVLILHEGKKVVVEATDSNGCHYRAEVTVKIYDSCNHKKYSENFSLYPNPTKDYLTIEIKDTLDHDAYVYIYDRHGKLVMKEIWYKGSKTLKLDLSNLQSGVYIVKIATKNGIAVFKVTKQ
jgi:hypothetical protein